MDRPEVVSAIWSRLDKPERWQALTDIRHKLSDGEFLRAFVDVWIDSEGNDLHLILIDRLIDEHRVSVERVMPVLSKSDQKFFADLPDDIVVYRGTSVEQPYGDYSWTTDKKQAVWFANRIPKGVPALACGVVSKAAILFASNSRGESEVAVRTNHVKHKRLEVIGEERDDPFAAFFFMVHQHTAFQDRQYAVFAQGLLQSGWNRKASQERLLSQVRELEDFGFVTAAEKRRKIVLEMNWDEIEKLCQDLSV